MVWRSHTLACADAHPCFYPPLSPSLPRMDLEAARRVRVAEQAAADAAQQAARKELLAAKLDQQDTLLKVGCCVKGSLRCGCKCAGGGAVNPCRSC